MTTSLNNPKVHTSPASERGERLYPPKNSRVFWHLSALRDLYAKVIKDFVAHNQDTNLLDFGCGNMPYRPLFPEINYIGADFPGNELAEVQIDSDGSLHISDDSVDIVLSSQVLEHVANVEHYLNESHRVLRPSGLLLLSTHGVWRYHPDPCDFWRWTCDGLKRTITAADFEIVFFQGIMGPEATALQLWQDSVATRMPSWLRSTFYRYMQWRIRRADERCSKTARDKDACVYLVVARKK